MTDLEKSILSTIAYFDVFDYPLTSVEIWKWLYIDPGQKNLKTKEPMNLRTEEQTEIFDVKNILEQSEFLKQKIDSKYGFYFLKGREEIVSIRRERYSLAERKFKKVIKIIKILRYVPYVKMIAICNTLSFSNCRDEGDIDLFIICEKGKIWQTRFFINGLLEILGVRPKPNETKDKICASFLLAEDNLNIEKIKINNDIYINYWISQLLPIYDEGYYNKFLSANTWVKKYLPNIFGVEPSLRRKVKKSLFFRKNLRPFFNTFGKNFCKKYQWKILPENLKKMANKDTRVILNDQMLKFHDNDRREYYRDRFIRRLKELL